MTVKHYVIGAFESMDKPGTEVYLIAALSARQAHEFAATSYRKERRLAPSVHVETSTLYKADEEDEAKAFMERLEKLIKEETP